MPETKESLLEIVQEAIPSVQDLQIDQSIIQASAEGYKLTTTTSTSTTTTATKDALHDQDDTPTEPQQLFVKLVDASKYSYKKWPDLRRVLLYARTEVRFYNETVPLLRNKGLDRIAPRCFHASYNLDGLISEQDRAVDVKNNVIPATYHNIGAGMGGRLVLETMNPQRYYQKSPLTPAQACLCLKAAAQLHAAAWEDPAILEPAHDRLSRGSYNLALRNPQEILDIAEGWQHFLTNFRNVAPDPYQQLLDRTDVQQLGKRIVRVAQPISDALSPQPHDPYATLVHGDLKSMNVFLPQNNNNNDNALLIDFASTGVGMGMSDVAMHVFHALLPQDLDEDFLLDSYLDHLHQYRKQYNNNNDDDKDVVVYPKSLAKRHFRMAVLDYFRFFLGRFWKKSTPDSMHKLKDNQNTNLINRDIASAMNFVQHVNEYLTEYEQQQQDNPTN